MSEHAAESPEHGLTPPSGDPGDQGLTALPLPPAPRDPWWVLAGLPSLARRPMLVVWPLLLTCVLWLLALTSGIYVIGWWWPSWAESTFWSWLLDVIIAISAGALVVGVVVTIVLPVLLGLIWEATVARVTRDRGIATPGETTIAGAGSAIGVLLRTMPWRIAWPLAGFIALWVAPPLAPVLTWLGHGHMLTLDAYDLALAVRGYSGKQRVAFFKQHRWSLLAGGGCSGIVGSGLSFTVVGLPLLTPMVFVGLAARLPAPEVVGEEDSDASEKNDANQ